jgi:hypothetical protein
MVKLYIPFWPKLLLRKMCELVVTIVGDDIIAGKIINDEMKIWIANKMLITVFDENLENAIKNIISLNTENTEKIKKILDVLRKALEVEA